MAADTSKRPCKATWKLHEVVGNQPNDICLKLDWKLHKVFCLRRGYMLSQRWPRVIDQGEILNGSASRFQCQRLCHLALRKVGHNSKPQKQSIIFQKLLLHYFELLLKRHKETHLSQLPLCTELMEREIKDLNNAVEVDQKPLQLAQPNVRVDWGESVWAFF